ncbi:hypothetical protein OY671_007774, partial [Metschnikowia pulcherrima]
MIPISAVTHSFSGLAWRWGGGNVDSGGWHGSSADDLVNQLLLSRGVAREDSERHRRPTSRDFMPDPSSFRDMDAAAERSASAVTAREAITVYGDYDVDGATSAASSIRSSRDLGVEARAYIPERSLEGYGPSGEASVRLAREGSSSTVTVDCGAMAHDASAAAHAEGVDVIVDDHHKCPPELPITAASVNPNRLDESYEAASHGHLAALASAQRAKHLADQLGSLHVAAQWQADEHIARGAEVLHSHLAELQALDRLARLGQIGRSGVSHLGERTAGELDGQVQAPRDEEEHRQGEGEEGNGVEDQRVPHERDVALDAEKCHGVSLRCL